MINHAAPAIVSNTDAQKGTVRIDVHGVMASTDPETIRNNLSNFPALGSKL